MSMIHEKSSLKEEKGMYMWKPAVNCGTESLLNRNRRFGVEIISLKKGAAVVHEEQMPENMFCKAKPRIARISWMNQ